ANMLTDEQVLECAGQLLVVQGEQDAGIRARSRRGLSHWAVPRHSDSTQKVSGLIVMPPWINTASFPLSKVKELLRQGWPPAQPLEPAKLFRRTPALSA